MAFLDIFKGYKWGKPTDLPSFLYIPGGLAGLFDFFDTPHHHPGPCTPPANSWRIKHFLSRLRGLWLFLSEGVELPSKAAAWLGDSLSPIGRLRSHYDF